MPRWRFADASASVQSGETGFGGAIGGVRVGNPSEFKIAWYVMVHGERLADAKRALAGAGYRVSD